MKRAKPKTVREYLARVPPEQRAVLEKLRHTIKAVVPDAAEIISYDIPTFKLDGRMLVSYAAFKNHCSFFPGAGPIERHQDELRSYRTSKGTIQFSVERHLPVALIKKLVKTRIELNTAAREKRGDS